MPKRSHNPRMFKKNFPYDISEIATKCNVHKNTVRAWRVDGLQSISDRRKPILFLGGEVIRYLTAKRTKNKRRLGPGEIYCVACHAAKQPAFSEVEYVSMTDNYGNLRGFCPTCERLINRGVQRVKLTTILGKLKVTNMEAILSFKGCKRTHRKQ
jgi:hypothetical protein